MEYLGYLDIFGYFEKHLATIGLVLTLGIFIYDIKKSNRLKSSQYLYRLVDKYDSIYEMRINNTDAMDCAEIKDFNFEEQSMSEKQKRYFYFIEMMIGYFELAFHMRYIDQTITEKNFQHYVFPIIRYEVKRNINIFSKIVNLDDDGISIGARKLIENAINTINHSNKD